MTAQVRWRLHLRSAPERVWWALSTDAGRARFWAERTVRRGDLIEWAFPNGMRTSGRIWAEQPCQRLELDSVLLALKAFVDHDVDLRNHDPTRTWDQGYCDN